MSEKDKPSEPEVSSAATPLFKVRLPGFVSDEQIGLGDVITRFTHMAGIEPCRGCTGRARALNQWITFTR
jgi:hypothetical protein